MVNYIHPPTHESLLLYLAKYHPDQALRLVERRVNLLVRRGPSTGSLDGCGGEGRPRKMSTLERRHLDICFDEDETVVTRKHAGQSREAAFHLNFFAILLWSAILKSREGYYPKISDCDETALTVSTF